MSTASKRSGGLRNLLGRVRLKLGARAPYLMSENPAYSSYDLGEGSYGYPEIAFYDAGAGLRIGKYCSIAPKVTILLGGEHHHDWVSSYPFSLMNEAAKGLPGYPFTKGDVVIGNDVWIGYDALILSGVTIGNGAVIAARSLITKDIEPYSIV
jgi:virginiamycin A acetyltransferase